MTSSASATFQMETIGHFSHSSLPARRFKTASRELFEKAYSLDGTTLGQGGNGKVYGGTRLRDGLPVAIKHVLRRKVTKWLPLSDLDPDSDHNYNALSIKIPLEVYLLLKVSHIEGVIQILDYFERGDSFIIIMEKPDPVKDLFEYITVRKFLKEKCARYFLRQLIDTILEIHAAGVIHRDIKGENILVAGKSRKLKLIDFGSGALLRKEPYKDFHGTTVYAPPELLKEKKYDGLEATVWSLGIQLFDMVCGDVPFQGREQILKAEIKFRRNLSDECKDLITACLNLNPSHRPTLEGILQHPWMRNKSGTANNTADSPQSNANIPQVQHHGHGLRLPHGLFLRNQIRTGPSPGNRNGTRAGVLLWRQSSLGSTSASSSAASSPSTSLQISEKHQVPEQISFLEKCQKGIALTARQQIQLLRNRNDIQHGRNPQYPHHG